MGKMQLHHINSISISYHKSINYITSIFIFHHPLLLFMFHLNLFWCRCRLLRPVLRTARKIVKMKTQGGKRLKKNTSRFRRDKQTTKTTNDSTTQICESTNQKIRILQNSILLFIQFRKLPRRYHFILSLFTSGH